MLCFVGSVRAGLAFPFLRLVTICRIAPLRRDAKIEMGSILTMLQRHTARRDNATYCDQP